jgi:hypothetical protein
VFVRELLELQDLPRAEKIDELEKYGAEDDLELGRFRAIRSDLSRIAWNVYSAALDCDSGPLSRTGVMTFPLDEAFADRLAAMLLGSARTQMRREDFALGYVCTATAQCEYLNACNEYRALGPDGLALLGELLTAVGPELERCIGHPFRVGSTRQFQLVPKRIAADRHVDGWPAAIRKVFILPRGAGRRTGTTWFRRRDGQEMEIESERPIWVVFENSVVWHAPISAEALRPTIEFDILPATETSLDPFNAGLAGWYPWFPTLNSLYEGTRIALARCYADEPAKGFIGRLKRLSRR